MFRTMRILVFAGTILTFAMTVGCAPSSYTVSTPKPSSFVFADAQNDQLSTHIIDERLEADRDFHIGILQATLVNEGKPIDPIEFLARNVEKELKARGVNVSFAEQGDGVTVKLHKFRIRNHRASGFSPYFTFTTISADVVAGGKTTRVTAYFKNGKVPVWSFDEVVEPCYNIPADLAIKEFASKINRLTKNFSISDADVEAILNGFKNNNTELSYLDVYKLGFSNNQRAIPYLVELTKHEKDVVRIAALSSLGTIGAVDQFDYLKEVYQTSPWQEKNMALKSIGDFGTPEALEFVKEVMRKLQRESNDPNDRYTIEVADLYL
jgi:hypothetical protein